MLRKLHVGDIDQLLLIEQSVHVAPWSKKIFAACLAAGNIGWVLESSQEIIGFVLISISVSECHILNLSVARIYQHQGWGSFLLKQVLQYAIEQKLKVVYLEVRRSNLSAIKLYKKMKFCLIGERKNYYQTVNGYEDALIFAQMIGDNRSES